jgi:hypothetical protein
VHDPTLTAFDARRLLVEGKHGPALDHARLFAVVQPPRDDWTYATICRFQYHESILGRQEERVEQCRLHILDIAHRERILQWTTVA